MMAEGLTLKMHLVGEGFSGAWAGLRGGWRGKWSVLGFSSQWLPMAGFSVLSWPQCCRLARVCFLHFVAW